MGKFAQILRRLEDYFILATLYARKAGEKLSIGN